MPAIYMQLCVLRSGKNYGFKLNIFYNLCLWLEIAHKTILFPTSEESLITRCSLTVIDKKLLRTVLSCERYVNRIY